jgi:hypothetical protein
MTAKPLIRTLPVLSDLQAWTSERLLLRMVGGSRHITAKRWFPAILGAATLGLLPPPQVQEKSFWCASRKSSVHDAQF